MAIDGSQIETKNIPRSQSKLKTSDWKQRITGKVEKNDEELRRFKGNPNLSPSRYRRHKAVQEIRTEQQLITDPLTGLATKKSFEDEERREIGIAERDLNSPPLEGILMDIDDFGKFNKDFGNSAGDEVLRKVGKAVLSTIRDTDISGRVGGEELAVVTRRTNNPNRDVYQEEIPLPAERIRQSIQDIKPDTGRRATVSIGVTEYKRGEGFEAYQARKETAQILAKRLGKNRVVEGLMIGSHEVFKDWSTNIFYEAVRGNNNEIIDTREVQIGNVLKQ